RNSRAPEKAETCTMCGDFCAMKKGMALFSGDIGGDKVNAAENQVHGFSRAGAGGPGQGA
ncbi:MAG: phosphomethylpyrimidine synthase ThiC, partial [Desulfobacteraceae bacterium]|nr:phosphomethylpyrimidine synthase ThiC [Desulfobacteraceae bacterium]